MTILKVGETMKVVTFNKPKSVWEILKECETDGVLDQKRAREILEPIDNSKGGKSTDFLRKYMTYL